MGIKTVMITGDNPQTAAAVAAEAGVDDFLAQATPEAKLKLIREMQAGGRLVAMTGDGTNDAPALAQADVAVAMNTGTQAAKEAGNLVDLDSNPTKLIEIVEIGKQLLMTRGALTTFSIANDVAKYFAIIPAAFATTYPALECAQHHGTGHAAKCRIVRRHFQCADHRRADSAGLARNCVSADRRRAVVKAASADLWHWVASSCRLSESKLIDMLLVALHLIWRKRRGVTMKEQIRTALTMLLIFTVLTGLLSPLGHGAGSTLLSRASERQPDRSRRQNDWVQVDWTVF